MKQPHFSLSDQSSYPPSSSHSSRKNSSTEEREKCLAFELAAASSENDVGASSPGAASIPIEEKQTTVEVESEQKEEKEKTSSSNSEPEVKKSESKPQQQSNQLEEGEIDASSAAPSTLNLTPSVLRAVEIASPPLSTPSSDSVSSSSSEENLAPATVGASISTESQPATEEEADYIMVEETRKD